MMYVSLPDGLTRIESFVFRDCSSITSLAIPESVTYIGQQAFDGCSSLTSVILPNGVTKLMFGAFAYCTNLMSITILAKEVPQGAGSMFDGTKCPIYVPEESVESYKNCQYWSTYANRIMPILAEGDDPDVLSKVSARYTGGSVVTINGVIQQNSRLNFFVYNNSSKAIKVLTVQLVDGVTGRPGNMMAVNTEIAPSSNSGWTITIGAGGIQSPIANFVFSCEGKRYEISAPYQEINIL